jgi:uncharacterized integral membrane protein
MPEANEIPTPQPAGRAPAKSRRERTSQVVTFVLGGLVALFAVLNLDEVDVNWIVGTRQTPLIVVIAVSLLLGSGLGYFLARRRARG